MFRNIFRKVFLCVALGGHSVLGVGMSQEKIEELLHAMNQTRVEVTISDDDETQHASLTSEGNLSENSTHRLTEIDELEWKRLSVKSRTKLGGD